MKCRLHVDQSPVGKQARYPSRLTSTMVADVAQIGRTGDTPSRASCLLAQLLVATEVWHAAAAAAAARAHQAHRRLVAQAFVGFGPRRR